MSIDILNFLNMYGAFIRLFIISFCLALFFWAIYILRSVYNTYYKKK
jgi:hypothetical protein